MKTLSKTQIEIIKLLQNGWYVGYMYDKCWGQKGKLGHGGESKTIRINTLWVLREKGFLEQTRNEINLQEYKISKKGQKIKV